MIFSLVLNWPAASTELTAVGFQLYLNAPRELSVLAECNRELDFLLVPLMFMSSSEE